MASLKEMIKKTKLSNDPRPSLFESYIDTLIRRYQQNEQRDRPDETFHVSSLLTEPDKFCARQKIYQYNERDKHMQPNLSPGTRRIFWNGNVHHEKWQKLFIKMNIALYIEKTRYSKYYHLTGTPDAIIEWAGKSYVVEIKTMNTHIFKKLKDVPKNALLQANFYMFLSGVPRAIVFIDNKNDHAIKTFFLDFDASIIYPYLSQHEEVVKYWKQKKIPPKKCFTKNEAKKCEYCNKCF